MNTFVTIEKLDDFTFDEVKYYSVRIDDSDNTEFEDFLTRMEAEHDYGEDLVNLIAWLIEIGENKGARENLFRHEGSISDAKALPPGAAIMETHELIVTDIRLYCQRLNEHVVILFNGGIKTKLRAQECPNVSIYFHQANRIAKRINELFVQKEISWTQGHTNIIFDKELTFEI